MMVLGLAFLSACCARYQNEWGKHVIRVQADDTSGYVVGGEWMKGISGTTMRRYVG